MEQLKKSLVGKIKKACRTSGSWQALTNQVSRSEPWAQRFVLAVAVVTLSYIDH